MELNLEGPRHLVSFMSTLLIIDINMVLFLLTGINFKKIIFLVEDII